MSADWEEKCQIWRLENACKENKQYGAINCCHHFKARVCLLTLSREGSWQSPTPGLAIHGKKVTAGFKVGCMTLHASYQRVAVPPEKAQAIVYTAAATSKIERSGKPRIHPQISQPPPFTPIKRYTSSCPSAVCLSASLLHTQNYLTHTLPQLLWLTHSNTCERKRTCRVEHSNRSILGAIDIDIFKRLPFPR